MPSLLKSIRPVWGNPVVTRDLRVRMRGSKSYWHQAAYLFLLGILAVAGYGAATNNGFSTGMSVVDAQLKLKEFYGFIFMTLAALMCLIAPALTAAAITTERQRLTLELLVATPLSAMELLVGKLVSSIAFLGLLLSLSLPASSLCVVLGGATLSNVIQVYILLAIDGLLLAAIGLFFSCAIRASLPAMAWTYFTVIAFLIFSATISAPLMSTMMFASGPSANPLLTFVCLNPFMAAAFGWKSFEIAGHAIPTFLGTAVIAFLLVRIVVTAAAYRMGNYGGNPAGSLRRQLLFATAAIGGLISYGTIGTITGFASMARSAGGTHSAPPSVVGQTIEGALIVAFVLSTLFLANLFVPVVVEDAPFGTVVDGKYRMKQAFRALHAGALPYYHLWLAVLVAAVLIGARASSGAFIAGTDLTRVWMTVYYLSALGFLFWAVARRCGSANRSESSARAMAFAIYLFFALLPPMIIRSMDMSWDKTDLIAVTWIFYPITKIMETASDSGLMLSGTIAYVFGALVYPFWANVYPGGKLKNAD